MTLCTAALQAQQAPPQPAVEFRTTGSEVDLKKDPLDPQAYLLKIPANSRIEIISPAPVNGIEPDQWYKILYLDQTGWLRGDTIETVPLETPPSPQTNASP